MAFTGFSVGTWYTSTQGTSTSMRCVIDKIRYYSSTGGIGKKCQISDKDGVVFFRGRVTGSYGFAPAAFEEGKLVNGMIVMSLPEGYVEIDVR